MFYFVSRKVSNSSKNSLLSFPSLYLSDTSMVFRDIPSDYTKDNSSSISMPLMSLILQDGLWLIPIRPMIS